MENSIYRVEVWLKPHIVDGRAEGLLASIASLGYPLERLQIVDLYFIEGRLSDQAMQRLCRELLADPISQDYRLSRLPDRPADQARQIAVEVTFHPGVTDTAAENIVRGARVIGVSGVEAAASGRRYVFGDSLSKEQAERIARDVLYNPIIQHFTLGAARPPFIHGSASTGGDAAHGVSVVPLVQADDGALEEINRERLLSLDPEEMRAIRSYFQKEGRNPTDAELETLAQTWSEHCSHKTFKGLVHYEERLLDGSVSREDIQGLLKTYIRRATEEIARPWVRSAFVDNAGIIDFDAGYEISFKAETHNHPSALEPFGGANTGVGGVLRDIIGVSARPIATTDVLCLGLLDSPPEDLASNVLHPSRIFEGAVAGVQDYGNKMGIPTVGGAVLFDAGYEANPLVFCGCLGLAPVGTHTAAPQRDDRVVSIGGRTGRDGLRGATFSSAELTHTVAEEYGSVVQIGDPITEKVALEAIMLARDERLYTAITDCGAGGFSSAVGEMGRELGVRVHLERAPLKYGGLAPWEIWLSEAQERMVVAVPPAHLDRLMSICDSLDVEATDIGEFTGTGRLEVLYGETTVVDLDMAFLHDGAPRRELTGLWTAKAFPCPPHHTGDLTAVLLEILRSPNVASKESVIRLYDHEAQGATVIKPLVGTKNHGPSDAAVLKPLQVSGWKGIALSHGINPCYGPLDPYLMAHAAIDEAVRNVVCAGADPDQLAILDNFCWGNPVLPDRMGDLVRACKGCYDAAVAYQTPFISGKDSLNNEYVDGLTGKKLSIPPTLLISAVGFVPDVRQAVTMDVKQAGNVVFAVGETRDELGGSHYYRLSGAIGDRAPQPAPDGLKIAKSLHGAMTQGLIRACHDCSEGGWAVALAEMSLAGGLGMEIHLPNAPGAGALPDDVTLCFSESNARYVVEVRPEDAEAFERIMADCPIARIGTVTAAPFLVVQGLGGGEVIRVELDALETAWRGDWEGAES